MNSLYVFAIGGSGERIFRSLMMLLYAGVDMPVNEVVPIFIDNDEKSKALEECLNLISFYNSTGDNNGGKPGLHTLYERSQLPRTPSFAHVKVSYPQCLNIAGHHLSNLENVIGAIGNSPIEYDLRTERDLLFSNEDLKMRLDVGFVGNPNIGSLVLSKAAVDIDSFQTVLNRANQNDGVLVIGSLFGGTGAAGLPLVVNNFTQRVQGVSRPLIGGIAVLPYFKTDSGDERANVINGMEGYDIHSETFGAKTRAALMYYDEYMDVSGMNYMYYLGSDIKASFPHCIGGNDQANYPTFVELLGAMSIVDFSKQDCQRRGKIIYKRPVWGFDDQKQTKTNLDGVTNEDIKKSIVKFQLLKHCFEQSVYLKKAIEEKMSFVSDIHFTQAILDNIINHPSGTYGFVLQNVSSSSCWALNNIFEWWDYWVFRLASASGAFSFNWANTGRYDDKDIMQKAFNTWRNHSQLHEIGIAKTRKKFFSRSEEIVPADILDFIGSTYRKHTGIVGVENILPLLLLNISDGLDKLLDDNSICEL